MIPLLREVRSGTQSLRAIAATLSMESDLEIDGESQFIGAEVAPSDGERLAVTQAIRGKRVEVTQHPGLNNGRVTFANPLSL